jgi:predicted PurR-regulated permease PerM
LEKELKQNSVVRIELTGKFLLYIVGLLVVLAVLWEVRSTAVTLGVMLFMAFIISAGLRPTVDNLEGRKLKFFFTLPLKLAVKATIALASLFGEKQEALATTKQVQNSLQGFYRAAVQRVPPLKWLNYFWELSVPRPLAIAVVYLVGIIGLVALFFSFTAEFARQLLNLYRELPSIITAAIDFINRSFPALGQALSLTTLAQQARDTIAHITSDDIFRSLLAGDFSSISGWVSSFLPTAVDVFSNVAGILLVGFTIIILSVYMLQTREAFYEPFVKMFSTGNAAKLRSILAEIEAKLGAWLSGQASLMVLIGTLTYFILVIPGWFYPGYRLDEFALPLALVAGLLEAVPNVGPTITTIVTAILAIGTSGLGSVLYVIISFAALQQVEAIVIVPQVMKRAVGIDPIFSIIAIIGGFQIGGVLGAILAIPTLGIAQIILGEVVRAYRGQN